MSNTENTSMKKFTFKLGWIGTETFVRKWSLMDVKSEAKNEWFSLELKMAIEKKQRKLQSTLCP